jgi:hypothetical protein
MVYESGESDMALEVRQSLIKVVKPRFGLGLSPSITVRFRAD